MTIHVTLKGYVKSHLESLSSHQNHKIISYNHNNTHKVNIMHVSFFRDVVFKQTHARGMGATPTKVFHKEPVKRNLSKGTGHAEPVTN